MKTELELLISDNQIGTDEYGYIPRLEGEDPDEEDLRYQKYLHAVTGNHQWRVVEAQAYLPSPPQLIEDLNVFVVQVH